MSQADLDAGLLARGGAELGVALDADQRETLLRYLDLVYVWNRSAGLTTIPRAEAVRLHLLDSLVAAEAVEVGPCIDLGTGAGLPGFVLAVAKPTLEFVLVESNRKKCSFLAEAVRAAGLSNVRVWQTDYAQIPVSHQYPTVISRAFRQPAEYLAIASKLAQRGGRVVMMLAEATDAEIGGLVGGSGLTPTGIRRTTLPGGVEPRTVISLQA